MKRTGALTSRFVCRKKSRNSLEAIKNLLITTKTGINVPLEQLAEVKMIEGPVQISRQDGVQKNRHRDEHQRQGYRQFCRRSKTEDKREGQAACRLLSHLGRTIRKPAAGHEQTDDHRTCRHRPDPASPVRTFRSIRLALLVISNLPFALIGGVFSLFISGQYLSVPASVGFVVLFGVAVLNGLVLVSRISQLREEGT